MAFCISCGTKMDDGVNFCPSCGTPRGSTGLAITQEKAVNIIQAQPTIIPTANIAPNQNIVMADEKYCFSCGLPVKKAAEICPKCGVNQNKRNITTVADVYCFSCGKIIKKEAEICPFCGVRQGNDYVATVSSPQPMQQTRETSYAVLSVDEKYCFSCGTPMKKAAEICQNCGINQRNKNNTKAIDVYCTSCGKLIKKEAEKCPYCGVQQYIMLCPKCGSEQVIQKQKGFSVGKAAVGALVAGPVGLAVGLIGNKKVKNTCLKCGNEWEVGK